MVGVAASARLEDLDVCNATLAVPDLTTFTGLDGLDVEVTGQGLEPERAVLSCRVVEPDEWCYWRAAWGWLVAR